MNTGRRDVIKKRRVNLLRRRIVIVGVTCIAMFLICATFVNLYNVNANNTSKNPLYKYYTSYQIEPGDTLTSIAQKYTINMMYLYRIILMRLRRIIILLAIRLTVEVI